MTSRLNIVLGANTLMQTHCLGATQRVQQTVTAIKQARRKQSLPVKDVSLPKTA